MSVVVLDTSPLGILANPRNPPHVIACRQWVARLQVAGWRLILPEIADYEVRRELIHRNSINGLANLDWLGRQFEYLPLNTAAMRQGRRVLGEGSPGRLAYCRPGRPGRGRNSRRPGDYAGRARV